MRLLRLYGGFAVAAALWLALAGPAVAGLHNATPADGSGDPNDQFVDNDALFAYTTTDVDGGYVCVVEADAAPDARCGGRGRTRVVGIGTQFTLLEADTCHRAIGGFRRSTRRGRTGSRAASSSSARAPKETETVTTRSRSSRSRRRRKLRTPSAYRWRSHVSVYAVNDLRSPSGDVAWRMVKDYHARHANYDGAGTIGCQATIVPIGAQLGLRFVIALSICWRARKRRQFRSSRTCRARWLRCTRHRRRSARSGVHDGGTTPTFSSLRTDSDPISGALMAALDLQTGYGETMLKAFERYQGALAAGEAAAPFAHAQAAALGRNGMDQVVRCTTRSTRCARRRSNSTRCPSSPVRS